MTWSDSRRVNFSDWLFKKDSDLLKSFTPLKQHAMPRRPRVQLRRQRSWTPSRRWVLKPCFCNVKAEAEADKADNEVRSPCTEPEVSPGRASSRARSFDGRGYAVRFLSIGVAKLHLMNFTRHLKCVERRRAQNLEAGDYIEVGPGERFAKTI